MSVRPVHGFVIALGLILLAGCSEQPAATAPAVAKVQKRTAPAPAAIDAASKAILAEPAVRNLDYRPDRAVQWIVAVDDDGTARFGYAAYICGLLGQHGAMTAESAVRVSSYDLQHGRGEEAREASLGAIRCKDEGHLDDAPAVGAGA
jgi:hypothetical protein